MKRCPQCDFVYEDDQALCDMDGSELASAPTSSLSLLPDRLPPTSTPPAKPRRKNFVGLALAVSCIAVVSSVYYGYRHGSVPESTANAAVTVLPAQPSIMTEQASPAPSPTPTPVAVQSKPTRAQASNRAVSVGRPAPTPAPTPKARPAPRRTEKPTELRNAPPKKQTGLVSLLKKAGRALKKPF